MRVLWISCLLIGCITCQPVNDPGSNQDVWPPYQPQWYLGAGGSDQGPDQSGAAGGYVGGDWAQSGQAGGSQGSPGSTGDPSDGGDDPFFSDTSHLDKVYSFSSRSRYQRGRALFHQTRYTPMDSLIPPMPIFKYSGETKAPVKGSF